MKKLIAVLLTLSLLLFISASYTPLPGASGAQEGGFLYYFRNIFTGGTTETSPSVIALNVPSDAIA